jgi:hypothetical protein
MNEPKKKPSVAFWATILLVAVLVLYVASFGVWCRVNRAGPGVIKARSVAIWPYYPLLWLIDDGPAPVKSALRSYVTWCLN